MDHVPEPVLGSWMGAVCVCVCTLGVGAELRCPQLRPTGGRAAHLVASYGGTVLSLPQAALFVKETMQKIRSGDFTIILPSD